MKFLKIEENKYGKFEITLEEEKEKINLFFPNKKIKIVRKFVSTLRNGQFDYSWTELPDYTVVPISVQSQLNNILYHYNQKKEYEEEIKEKERHQTDYNAAINRCIERAKKSRES